MHSLLGLDPAAYVQSALHGPDRTFRETNCYTDIWIELLHARGIDPASAMAYALTVDFEGDQWSFFKPPPEDLERLYGIEVHEMQLYRPMVEHFTEQLSAGRTMIIEADSFYMPDTAATAYRQAHVKSSIVVEAIDPEAERLRYFHNAGFFEVAGDDFRNLLRIAREFSPDVLPPYAEIVRFDAGPCLEGEALREAARAVLARHLDRMPRRNPWLTFAERFMHDLPQLLSGTEAGYHAYAFATVRQCGAAFELAQSFVEWLEGPQAASQALARQTAGAKALLLKLARRRAFDPAPLLAGMAADWERARETLCSWAAAREGLVVR
jgi:hypothetical protein